MMLRRVPVPPGSPSLWPRRILDGDDEWSPEQPGKSPCARGNPKYEPRDAIGDEEQLSLPETPDDVDHSLPGSSIDVVMTKAECARASRAARASEPSSSATTRAYAVVCEGLERVRASGAQRAPAATAFRSFRAPSASGGKGPAVRTSAESQARTNHLAALKAKDVDSQNTEPAFLLGGFTTPMAWDRLAENSLRSNAVNSSVLNRKKTQGAANQTTRISCKSIGQAAASQLCAVAVSMARSRFVLRREGVNVANPVATNSMELCALCLGDNSDVSHEKLFCVTSTSRLVYNSSPVKLSSVSVLSTCMDLARRELEENHISDKMCTRTHQFADICKSLVGEAQLDAVWCSWVLIVYLCSHPRGRDLLRASGLTDVDIQSAVVFERYGGEEIRRRVRQRRNEEQPKKRPREEEDEDGKRKRVVRGPLPSVCSDAHCIVEFWHSALQSSDVSVLHTLASHSKRTARDAALSTLARQATGTDVADNALLQSLSLQNAIKSAQALVPFVGRRVDDIPSVVAFYARDPKNKQLVVSCGHARIKNEAASSSLHACTLPPLSVRPSAECGVQISWSFASKKLVPTSADTSTVPGVLERLREVGRIADLERRPAKAERASAVMSSYCDLESEMALSMSLAGTSRSFLSVRTILPFNSTHEAAAASLTAEAQRLLENVNEESPRPSRLPTVLGKSQDNSTRSEPLCTPASPLALGISSNEILRRWQACRTRKNDASRVAIGFVMPTEVARDSPGIMSSEPLPLLTVTDVEVECIGEPEVQPGGRLGSVPASLGVHVCGDGATRVSDLLRCMSKASMDEVKFYKEARAAIFVSASQASYIGVVASALGSGYTNASVASSKKITTPDVNKLLLLTPFDCYAAGLSNIVRSFDPSPYSGTYGPRVDTGFTPHGLFAHNYRSDRRQHGNCCLSQEAADELSDEFAKAHWKVFDDHASVDRGDDPPTKRFAAIPVAARGIPHGFVPGVHSVLGDYCDFVETYRSLTERRDADTVDSILCLPFGPFSQALAPDLEPSVDASLRTCVRDPHESSAATGRAYLVDATSEDTAIVREPLFRRPCQTSSGDCPFATAYENVDSFFNAASSLALLCRALNDYFKLADSAVESMHKVIGMFIDGDSELTPVLSCWAADALVLLNVLFPSNLEVGELALLPAFAKAAPACHRALKEGRVLDLARVPGLADVDVRYARLFWGAFRRDSAETCAWHSGVAPLLDLVISHDGSHNTPLGVISEVRYALERAVRSVWLVHSDDGISPPPSYHPTASAKSVAQVGRSHIDPLFVGDVELGVKQRASPIGIKPHSYRQILAELLGAAVPGVEVNVALNEGGLALRVSSDPTILDERARPRTEKSISPCQTEGDHRGYGSRNDKLVGATKQKSAFDTNALILSPLFTAIEPPCHPDTRARGEFGLSSFFSSEQAKMHRDSLRVDKRLANAKNMMIAAAESEVAREVNSRL